jgi:hypothetical protein
VELPLALGNLELPTGPQENYAEKDAWCRLINCGTLALPSPGSLLASFSPDEQFEEQKNGGKDEEALSRPACTGDCLFNSGGSSC